MNLPTELQTLFNTHALPGLGPERRPEALPLAECQSQIGEALKKLTPPKQAGQLLRSAALLWHDHLDESHTISQDIHNADGSLLHGIMHRREPDYPNAKYWFNRTGYHPIFDELASRCSEPLATCSLDALIAGPWDAFAVVDAVSRASAGTEDYRCLQRIQAEEIAALMERIFDY